MRKRLHTRGVHTALPCPPTRPGKALPCLVLALQLARRGPPHLTLMTGADLKPRDAGEVFACLGIVSKAVRVKINRKATSRIDQA